MRALSESQFLRWAEARGLELDPQYPESAVLSFRQAATARFWSVPIEPERRPYFLSSLLEFFGGWESCFAWRHLGSWPAADHINPARVNDVVEHHILAALGLPMGTGSVVEFDRSETPTLLTLLF